MSEPILSKLIPDPEDSRDWIFEPDYGVDLPSSLDLRGFAGVVENQLSVGACAGNAGASGCEMYLISDGRLVDTEGMDGFDLSRLFPYRLSRKVLNLPDTLEGTTLREIMRVLKNTGICRESVWPYVVAMANVDPTPEAMADAQNHKLHAYYRIPLSNIDKALYAVQYSLAKGWPVAVAMRVGRMLQNLTPDQHYTFINSNNPEWGGHAMLIVGYVRINGILYWIIKNSHGPEWCDKGYFLCMATITVINGIDLWVMQGFAGIERVGQDQTKPKPLPEPTPEPTPAPTPAPESAPTPAPEPIPEPPKPAPDPAPEPAPQPEKKSGKVVLIVGIIIGIIVLGHFGGLF